MAAEAGAPGKDGWDFRNPFTLVWAIAGSTFGVVEWVVAGWKPGVVTIVEDLAVAAFAASPGMTRRRRRAMARRAQKRSMGPRFETARDRDE